jgi:uncharacterized membrane protein
LLTCAAITTPLAEEYQVVIQGAVTEIVWQWTIFLFVWSIKPFSFTSVLAFTTETSFSGLQHFCLLCTVIHSVSRFC